MIQDLTNELDAADHITEFVSTGPKAYAYKTLLGNTTTKLKGFTLNHMNSQQVNFEAMKKLVMDGGCVTTVNPSKICRNTVKSIIYSVHEEKVYGMVYDKRVIQTDHSTLPYGYLKKSCGTEEEEEAAAYKKHLPDDDTAQHVGRLLLVEKKKKTPISNIS